MTLYEKRGRRYFPVRDTLAWSGLDNGAWLVVVKDGLTHVRRVVKPDHVAVAAALAPLRAELAQILLEGTRERPTERENTPKEKRAYAAYCKVMGSDCGLTLTRDCAAEVAERVIDLAMELAGLDLALEKVGKKRV